MAPQKKKTNSDAAGTDILESGRTTLALEAAAIDALSRTLGESFEFAVKLLLEIAPGGRVVVSGMGKAGFIAMKTSATLASVSVPSFFLHPAEAYHGDLGRFTSSDIALIISNSGETPEVVRLLPHLKTIGCQVIAITASEDSSLGRHSDVTLSIGKVEEAGPLSLAPTTSTTVMLALGDALAMAVLKYRGLSKEQYRAFHPGGNLGQSLMSVSMIMRTGDEHCIVRADEVTREVLHKITITKRRPGAASIVDRNGILTGVFTDGDLRRCLEKDERFLDRPIGDFMGKTPKTIGPEQLVQEAHHIMSVAKIDQLIVIDKLGKPVGMIDIQDVIEVKA